MIRKLEMLYGADPELFLKRNGQIIGSEKLIPVHGLSYLVKRDGVQVELHPEPQSTVSSLGKQITAAFRLLKEKLADVNKDSNEPISLSFDLMVEVSQAELGSLSPESQVLGCQPSENYYGEKPITIDASKYRKRSAGGHPHFGLKGIDALFNPEYYWDNNEKPDPQPAVIVPLFDVLLGNTMVLLDRDPGNAERRENYGRAGEYRLQPHGIEYRTPTNFWLRNYSLMSLVFALGSMAVSVAAQAKYGDDIEGELIDVVNIRRVREAIDTNDFELALLNFKNIVPVLRRHLPETGEFQLTPNNLDGFVGFANAVEQKGITTYFPSDPMAHWLTEPQVEFKTFLEALIK